MALENYLSAGVHIGMKQRTKDMARFIYKIRPDGLSVLNVQTIEQRILTAAKFLARSKKIMVISRKTNGQKPVAKFSEIIGARAVVGRFFPGILTNPSFREYFEPEVVMVTDPLADRQAVKEAVRMRIPVIALCDTFNETMDIDFIIPANNKGRKALALVYYLLAKEVLKNRGEIKSDEEFKQKIEDFEAEEVREEEFREE